MRSTFNLKDPKKNGATSVRFIAFFKDENKSMVYSTGEQIDPKDWDFELRQPKYLTGRNAKADQMRSIKNQLDRYSMLLLELSNRFKVLKEDITIAAVKKEFNRNFKRTKKSAGKFFEVYDEFLQSKISDNSTSANSQTTIKRYIYNKKLLEQYQSFTNKKLNFNSINQSFYNDFMGYCIDQKQHAINTLSRNMGLLKTFMYWAFENNYTYKDDFKSFKNIKKEITDEVALTFDQVLEVYTYDFSGNKKLQRVRDLFVFGCATGLRYSNYSKITKSDIYNEHINVRDMKNSDKLLSIPLNEFSKSILEIYSYELPYISNQKFNDYIKEVFKTVGYDQPIKKSTKIGNKIIDNITPLYQRISSHTARRSFITIMKNKKIPDKVIMSYTGHKSLEVFNKYYKPNNEEKVDFMQAVWKLDTTITIN